MLIEYKTILMGDQALNLDKNGKRYNNPSDVGAYEIIHINYCCDEIDTWIKWGTWPPRFSDDKYNEPEHRFSVNYSYPELDEYVNLELKYCPFCGKEIIYQETQKVQLRAEKKEKIEYTDYYEEEIK